MMDPVENVAVKVFACAVHNKDTLASLGYSGAAK